MPTIDAVPPIKVILDTNIYVAAALNPDGLMYKIIRDSAAKNLAVYASSEEILLELQHKLETKLQFERKDLIAWMKQMRKILEIVYPSQKLNVIERDPDDNKILECAVEAKADLIITADKDLLTLKTYQATKILHPSSFKYAFPTLNHN